MRSHRFTLLALAAFLFPGLVPSGYAQPVIGLYRNGQLIDAFGTVPASPPSSEQLQSAGSAPQPAPAVSGPDVSEETRARNLAFSQGAQPAVEIRDLLRQMQQPVGRNRAADNRRLGSLLQEFLALQDQARDMMTATGDRLLQLQLDPSIYQRHVDTMAAFEGGLSEFTDAVNAVLAGRPGALDQAQAVMERLRFREEPDLTKVGPKRVPMQIRPAPQLTREEADALLAAHSASAAALPSQQSELALAAATASSPPTPADLAPTIDVQITAEITDKAAELANSPLAIYEFVRNNIAFQPYLGSRKGSVFTLQQRAGNDTDQASLLLALLRAANIPSRYVRGTVEMTPQQAMDWLGVEDAATAGSILTTAGLDGVRVIDGTGTVVAIRCTRVWVEAYVPYGNYRGVPNDATGKTWIPLDPGYKGNIVQSGEDVLTAMGFNTDTFLADYISTFHAQSPLEKLQADVQTWLDVNRPGTTVVDIERTLTLSPLNLGVLPSSLPSKALVVSGRFSELEGTKRYHVRLHLHDGGTTFIDYTISLPELITKRLVIDYIGATPADQATIDAYGGIYQTPPNLVNVKPRLKLDGTAVVTSTNASGVGYTHDWDMHFLEPVGDQNVQPVIYNTITTGNGQSVAFDTFLDVPLGFLAGSSSSGSLLESTLNDTAAQYLSRVDRGEETASGLLRMVSTVDVSEAIVENSVKVTYSFGTPVTFEWTGLIVDADRRIIGPFAANGSSANNVPYMKLTGYDASNMENRVFEDIYGQEAVSTIKILELANDAGIGVCTITSSIAAQCPGFNQPGLVSTINAALAQGHHVIIPKAPITVHLWSGTGYIDLDPATGAAGYIISGGINGNIVVAGGATVDIWIVFLPCPTPTIVNDSSDPIRSYYDGEGTPIDLFCGSDPRHIRLKGHYIVQCPGRPDAPQSFDHSIWLPIDWIAWLYGPGEYSFSVASTVLHSFTIYTFEFTKFIFTSDHGLLTNWTRNYAVAGGSTYNPRGWVKGGILGLGGANNPVTHTKASSVEADVTVRLQPSGIPYNLTGTAPVNGLSFQEAGLTSSGRDQVVHVTSSAALPPEVGIFTYAIDWSAAINGATCGHQQSGPHKLHVLWASPGNGPTVKRVDWACTTAQGTASITAAAESFRDTISTTPGIDPNTWDLDSWAFLDSGKGGDCITLARLASEGLKMIGTAAQARWAFPTADGTPGFPPISASTCTTKTTKQFQSQGEWFNAKLVYPGNNFEGFFTVSDPGTKAYTVYPPAGPYENPTYYYLQVLASVASDQFWVWDGTQTKNGKTVIDWTAVPGEPHIPVPSPPP